MPEAWTCHYSSSHPTGHDGLTWAGPSPLLPLRMGGGQGPALRCCMAAAAACRALGQCWRSAPAHRLHCTACCEAHCAHHQSTCTPLRNHLHSLPYSSALYVITDCAHRRSHLHSLLPCPALIFSTPFCTALRCTQVLDAPLHCLSVHPCNTPRSFCPVVRCSWRWLATAAWSSCLLWPSSWPSRPSATACPPLHRETSRPYPLAI